MKSLVSCADAQTDLGICCPHMPEDTFLHGATQFKMRVCHLLSALMEIASMEGTFNLHWFPILLPIFFFLFRLYLTGVYVALTHLCLAFDKMVIDKQYRPRSDSAERDVWSGSTMFAFRTEITINMKTIKTNQTLLILEMNRSKELM